MVRDFQSVIGNEARAQIMEAEGRLPDVVIASVGGGSNAMGIFHPFLDEPGVRLIGVEAAGRGLDSGAQAASIERGRPGVLHGNRTYLLQDGEGQITEAHSISAGLCTRTEGIIPALECAHALAHIEKIAPGMDAEQIILMNLSGRGDKDIFTVAEHLGARL
jgi:tryptophan synthase beta chain